MNDSALLEQSDYITIPTIDQFEVDSELIVRDMYIAEVHKIILKLKLKFKYGGGDSRSHPCDYYACNLSGDLVILEEIMYPYNFQSPPLSAADVCQLFVDESHKCGVGASTDHLINKMMQVFGYMLDHTCAYSLLNISDYFYVLHRSY